MSEKITISDIQKSIPFIGYRSIGIRGMLGTAYDNAKKGGASEKKAILAAVSQTIKMLEDIIDERDKQASTNFKPNRETR